MKILNLYAGIGGNRKLWGDEHDITAVEFDPSIAEAYKSRFPNDNVVVGDAKQYLLDHYKEFDFIWASPPCQTHSRLTTGAYLRDTYIPKYPDVSLYQIISFLKLHCKRQKWLVENVKPYYDVWIKEDVEIDRHLYWSNFKISKIEVQKEHIISEVKSSDFDKLGLKDIGIKNKIQVVRNQVNGDIGKHILDCAIGTVKHKQGGLFND